VKPSNFDEPHCEGGTREAEQRMRALTRKYKAAEKRCSKHAVQDLGELEEYKEAASAKGKEGLHERLHLVR
jgi:hypothetical protein